MPIKYIVLIASGNERDNTLMRVLTSKIIELGKLNECYKNYKNSTMEQNIMESTKKSRKIIKFW
jgi:hypothetical protein